MFKLFVRNKRAVAAAMSAMLIATAFTPGGCTITVDEDVVQQLVDWASDFEAPWEQGSSGHWESSGSWGSSECDQADPCEAAPQ